MTVVQDDDYAAGLYRDQDDTPGGRARPAKHSRPAGSAARVQENHNIACTPSSVRVRSRLGARFAVARRAAHMLQLHWRTAQGAGCAPHKSRRWSVTRACVERAPNSRKHRSERFVTLTTQLGVEQALSTPLRGGHLYTSNGCLYTNIGSNIDIGGLYWYTPVPVEGSYTGIESYTDIAPAILV